MAVTITEFNGGHRERSVLIGLVVCAPLLGRVAQKYSGDLFASDWANLVAKWCVNYFRRYGAAPGRAVESLFKAWADGSRDKANVALVESFLDACSRQYDQAGEVNVAHLYDLAGEHFDAVRLERMAERVKGHLAAGSINEARKCASEFRSIGVGASDEVDSFIDREALVADFAREVHAPLVEYGGALGEFFLNQLCRDALVAFMGPEKSGKSQWLLDVAYRAMISRRRVAFFSVGDMTRAQVHQRLMARNALHPYTSPTGNWPCEIDYPILITPAPAGSGKLPEIEYEKLTFDEAIDAAIAWHHCERTMIEKVKSERSYFKLVTRPAGSIGVADVRAKLIDWEADGWLADVVVIDYADLLAPPPASGRMDARDHINKTWEAMSALRSERHVLLVTATQANRESYDQHLIGRRNVGEDKRKHSHVTMMVGINVTDAERESNLCRLNKLDVRDGAFSPRHAVCVAQCLALAHPSVLSVWPPRRPEPMFVEDDNDAESAGGPSGAKSRRMKSRGGKSSRRGADR